MGLDYCAEGYCGSIFIINDMISIVGAVITTIYIRIINMESCFGIN